jgi:hypothetical protein
MQIQRITSLLQGVASSRNWLIEHIPLTSSMAGYDLFLAVANNFTAGKPILLRDLLADSRHPERVVLQQIEKMQATGLLAAQPGAIGPHARAFQPTQQFVALLDRFSKQFESLFILRKGLRDQQLVVVTDEAAMRDFAETLYDHFYDLGWFYLHNFGSACFLMASLVARIATSYGLRARVASCYVSIAEGKNSFLLGAQGYARPGQIDGHAVCILEESLLIDFGLGNVRRTYRRDFPWAMATPYRRDGATIAALATPAGSVTWKDDWQSPDSEAELARYAPHLEGLYQQYRGYFA